MSKRANGEGSIIKRSDGRWMARVTSPNGQRRSFYGETRQEVAQRLTETLKAVQDGRPVASGVLTVKGFLEKWLEAIKPTVRARTWERYEQYVRLHTLPKLGKIRLAR